MIQSRGRWNSRAIAQELEISERTVYRDLQVLEFAGVPWYFDDEDQCYRVRADFRFPTLGLTDEEAAGQAVATALSRAVGLNASQGSQPTTRKLSSNSTPAIQQALDDAARLIEVFDLKLVDHSRHQEAIKAAQHALLHGKQLIGGALLPLENGSLHYWAPEVVFHEGTYYLYYSAGTLPDLHFTLRVATSEKPEGPFQDTGSPLKDGDGAPFFIDGHAYQDDDGTWYMFYAKDFPNTDDGYKAGTGIVVDRLLDMTRLEGKSRLVVRPRYDWTLFEANRKMDLYGRKIFDWHTIEAPWIVKHDGRYYCFYSGSNFGTENYGLDFVEAEKITGPYTDQGQYARVLRGVPHLVRGPGHHSIVTAPDGETEIVVYHAWNEQMTARQMCIDPLIWTSRGPRCLGPSVGSHDLAVSGK